MEQDNSTVEPKPAPIESVPVLPYSVIEGQLDHSDPVWLGRISAAVIVFFFALVCAFLDDGWRGLREHVGIDAAGWTYYLDYILYGARMMLFAAACWLLAMKEIGGPSANRSSLAAMPWLALAAAGTSLGNYYLAAYIGVPDQASVWLTIAGVAAAASLCAGVIAGTQLLAIARRAPNIFLARRIHFAIFATAGVWCAASLVQFSPLIGLEWLLPQAGDPLPKILAVATLAAECFTAVVLLQLLNTINTAANTARHVALRALRQQDADS